MATNKFGVHVALIFALGTLVAGVFGHAGTFHLCPDTPSGRNYARYELGNCTTFQTVNATANVTATGKVTLWMYAYQNCSDQLSSALEFNTVLYRNGQPLSSTNTTGQAYTGKCAAANRAVYTDVQVLAMDENNYIWWKRTPTTANGTLCGNAANTFVVRAMDTAGQLEGQPLQSFVLSTPETGPALCCDFDLFPKVTKETVASQVGACYSPPPPPPPRPSPSPSGGAATALRTSVIAVASAAMLLGMLLL